MIPAARIAAPVALAVKLVPIDGADDGRLLGRHFPLEHHSMMSSDVVKGRRKRFRGNVAAPV